MENNDLLIRLVRNTVSKFEVLCEINKRNIEISKNEDFILLKLLLQIDLAKELLSTEDEEQKRRYEDILRNSEGHLKQGCLPSRRLSSPFGTLAALAQSW